MTRHRVIAGLVGLLVLACTGSNSNLNSGASSGGSGNSSGGSGNSSGGSGNSSGGSGNSSGGSADSSGGSADSSGNSSQGSANASGNTANGLNASADSSANSVQGSVASTSQGLADSSAQSTRASLPILATVAMGVTVVGVGYLIWGQATRASLALPPPVPPAPAAPAAAAQFLRASERQLRMDLAVGAGPAIDDLAALAEIRPRNLPRFGRLLREHRHELLTWTDARALTPAVAAQVLRRVGEIAAQDGALAEDGRAFRERHPGT
jgi:hypothetical protein